MTTTVCSYILKCPGRLNPECLFIYHHHHHNHPHHVLLLYKVHQHTQCVIRSAEGVLKAFLNSTYQSVIIFPRGFNQSHYNYNKQQWYVGGK